VLILGYRTIIQSPADHAFARCARIVSFVGAAWIGTEFAIDVILGFLHPFLKLYTTTELFADIRFYIGYAISIRRSVFKSQKRFSRTLTCSAIRRKTAVTVEVDQARINAVQSAFSPRSALMLQRFETDPRN
jgi:hypothetical protein